MIMNHAYVEHADWNCLPSEPLVSIAMATYNHERYLQDAIEGIVRQCTDFPIELIIGDDCSTDRTGEIARAYQRAYPGIIRVLSGERNVGMHENGARIISVARGRYLAFCEGDDFWHRPDKLRDQIHLIENDSTISLVCSSWRIISEEGIILEPDVLGLNKSSKQWFGLDDILAKRVMTVTVCTKTDLVRQSLKESPLCRLGRYPFGDAPMWVEVSHHGRCVCLPQEYGTYRLSRNSATRPSDIMDVYRFIAGACEFDRDVLGIYRLPQGEQAAREVRIEATRKRLRALALLGEAGKVREELWWLYRLGARAHFREYLLYLGSILSQAGTLGASPRQWILLTWHSLAHRHQSLWSPPNPKMSMQRAVNSHEANVTGPC
jgi:glycosyltransferase involved in cell wall biosynthesis